MEKLTIILNDPSYRTERIHNGLLRFSSPLCGCSGQPLPGGRKKANAGERWG
jgi:hypothetical protein